MKKTLSGMILITGLLLAGSEASTFEIQVVTNLIGLILFAGGGWLFTNEYIKKGVRK